MKIQTKPLTGDDLNDKIVEMAVANGYVNHDSVLANAANYDTSVNEEIAKQINEWLEKASAFIELL